MNEIVEAFVKLGMQASYHYADDSTAEWKLGGQAKAKALELFDANPELQEEMRKEAVGFLWSISMERPA